MRSFSLILAAVIFQGGLSPLNAQRTRAGRDFPVFHSVGRNEAVEHLAVDNQGRVWFSTQRLDPDGTRSFGIGHLNEGRSASTISTPFRVLDLLFSAEGELWMTAPEGKLSLLRTDGTFERQDLGEFGVGADLKLGPDLYLYSVSSRRNQILKFEPVSRQVAWIGVGPEEISTKLAVSPFGDIWFATNDNRAGLRTRDGKVRLFDLDLDFASDRTQGVSGIASGYDGGAWLTVTGANTSLFHQPTPYVLHIRNDGTIDQRLVREFYPYSPVLLRSGELIFLEALGRPYRARLIQIRGSSTSEVLAPLEGLQSFQFAQFYEAVEGTKGTVFVGTHGGILEVEIQSRQNRHRSRRN